MSPRPSARMPGSTSRVTRKRLRRLVRIVVSQSSSVSSRNGLATSMPALFTSVSIGPSAARNALDQRLHLRIIADIGGKTLGRNAGAAQFEQQPLQSRRGAGTDTHGPPGPPQREGDGATDAFSRAGDEGNTGSSHAG